MMNKKIEEAIEQAARLAAPVFAAMGWTWALTDPHTPSIDEIKTAYRELVATGSKTCGSGRLTVERGRGGVEFGMELGFVEDE